MLDRDGILKSDDLPRELVDVPEWGGELYVRTLTGSERDEFEQSMVTGKGKTNLDNVRARFAVLTICDSEGKRIFRASDAEALGKKSAAALGKVFDVASRMNGFSQQDAEELTQSF